MKGIQTNCPLFDVILIVWRIQIKLFLHLPSLHQRIFVIALDFITKIYNKNLLRVAVHKVLASVLNFDLYWPQGRA